MTATVPPSRSYAAGRPGRAWTAVVVVLAGAVTAVPLVADADDGDDATPAPTTTAAATPGTTAPPTTAPPTTAPPTTAPPADTTPTTTAPPTTVPTTTAPAPETTAPTTAPPTTAPPTTAPPADTTPTTTAPTTTVPTTTPTTSPPAPSAPPAPPERNITVYPEQMQHILATIRYLESRGIYTLPPNKGNASGAYQFIGSTWNDYGGYAHAYLAPPHVQDERAAKDVQMFLDRFDNDVSMVPVMWYYPRAAREPHLMDIVPMPQHGNIYTIREYQTKWLNVFAYISGQPIAPLLSGEDAAARSGRPPFVPEAAAAGDRAIAFPVLGPSRVAIPECDDASAIETADVGGDGAPSGPSRADIEAAGLCTEHAPGIVFGVKLQPVLTVADGIVTAVDDEPASGRPITVTVTGPDGVSYVYSGFNDDTPGTDDGAAPDHLRLTALAQLGVSVRAGQVLGFMGDTDPLPLGVRADVPTDATVTIDPDAVAPHIRITMFDLDGQPLDAYLPTIDALFRQTCSVGIGPWSVTPRFARHDPVVIETTDRHDDIDSEWVITEHGQVTAAGWAAMINPTESCGFVPPSPHGPGADGSSEAYLHWAVPLDLPTEVWIRLALLDDPAPGGFVRN